MRVCVVGAGVIGATAAKMFSEEGVNVTCLDAGKAKAGTPPSGGHLNPDWFKGMAKDDYEPGLRILNDIWGLDTQKYLLRTKKGERRGLVPMYRLNTDLITSFPSQKATVSKIRYSGMKPEVVVKDKLGTVRQVYDLVIVAVGVWASELMPELFKDNPIRRKQGISFRFEKKVYQPVVQPWQPYKQLVVHAQDERSVWVGDGTAILEKNWTPERSQQCLTRCQSFIRTTKRPLETREGLRAYCKLAKKSDPCLILRPSPKVWVVTGAEKLGTIASGIVANRLAQEYL